MDEARIVIQQRFAELDKINKQRRIWLYISSSVVMYAIAVITAIDYIFADKHSLLGWAIISASLLLSISWWYWTMGIIRTIINDLFLEYTILQEIISEVSEIVHDYRPLDIDKKE